MTIIQFSKKKIYEPPNDVFASANRRNLLVSIVMGNDVFHLPSNTDVENQNEIEIDQWLRVEIAQVERIESNESNESN